MISGGKDVNLFADFAIFEKLAAVYFIARSVSQSVGMAQSSIKFIGEILIKFYRVGLVR